MFRNLCGAENYKNIVVITTFWDKISNQNDGIQREEQLKTKFFKELVDRGARFMRYDCTAECAHEVLKHIFTLVPTNVQIQHEIRVEGKSLEDTAAGSVHREEVERIIAKHEEELAELRVEMEKVMIHNAEFRRELEAERTQARQHLERWEKEKSELKDGLVGVRNDRARLEAEVATERKNHEQLSQESEREWTSRLDSHAKAHDVAVRNMQDQLDQERMDAARVRMEMDKMAREEMRRTQREQDSDTEATLRGEEEMAERKREEWKEVEEKKMIEQRREEEEYERIATEEEMDSPPPYTAIDHGELTTYSISSPSSSRN